MSAGETDHNVKGHYEAYWTTVAGRSYFMAQPKEELRLPSPLTSGISRRSLLILLSCAAFVPRLADAQVTDAFDPLTVPTPPMICRWIPPTPRDSVAFIIEFLDRPDSLGNRVSRTFFDSAGTPRYMFVSAPRTVSATEIREYIVVVQFHPKRIGGTVIIPATFSSPSSDSAKREPTIKEDLTEPAIAHAEALARWFWEHRCSQSPPVP